MKKLFSLFVLIAATVSAQVPLKIALPENDTTHYSFSKHRFAGSTRPDVRVFVNGSCRPHTLSELARASWGLVVTASEGVARGSKSSLAQWPIEQTSASGERCAVGAARGARGARSDRDVIWPVATYGPARWYQRLQW